MKGYTKGKGKGRKFIPTTRKSQSLMSNEDMKKFDKTRNQVHKANNKVAQDLRKKKTLDTPSVEIENRAWKGIRVVSDNFKRDGKNVFITIDTHHPKGKYILEIHNEFQNDREGLPKIKEEFDTFQEVIDYANEELNIDIKQKDQKGDDFSWEEQIKNTDHDLPYERVYWSLPEPAKQDHYNYNENVKREEIPEFIERLQKRKSKYLKGTEFEA